MKLDIPNTKDARIFIIEGIAGSGKDTMQGKLYEHLDSQGFLVYSFSEDDLLFSWRHFWIKSMETIRINYLHLLLDHLEKTIRENRKSAIILNRFHISYAVFSKYDPKAKRSYDLLIKRLKNLPVHIFIGELNADKIEKWSSHSERKEKIWRIHQKKRVKTANASSLSELLKNEQDIIFDIAKKQGIPYSVFKF